jgi:hypothetical protein
MSNLSFIEQLQQDNIGIAEYLFENDSKEIKKYHLQNVQFGLAKVKNIKGDFEEKYGLLFTLHSKLCNVMNILDNDELDVAVTELFIAEPSGAFRSDLETLGNYIAQIVDSGEKLAVTSVLNNISVSAMTQIADQVKVADNASNVNNEDLTTEMLYSQDTQETNKNKEYNYRVNVFEVLYATLGRHRSVVDFNTGISHLTPLKEYFNKFVLSNNLFYIKDEHDNIGDGYYVNVNKYLTQVEEKFKPLYDVLKNGFRGLHFELQLEIIAWYNAFFFLLLENRSIIDVINLSKMAITLEELRNATYKEQIKRIEEVILLQDATP